MRQHHQLSVQLKAYQNLPVSPQRRRATRCYAAIFWPSNFLALASSASHFASC